MSERSKLRKARKYEAMDEESINKACSALLHTPDGQKFVGWLMDITHFLQSTFTGNALTGAFRQGEQNVGQQLLARFTEIDPEGFLAFLKARTAEYEQRERDINGSDGDHRVTHYESEPDDGPAEFN